MKPFIDIIISIIEVLYIGHSSVLHLPPFGDIPNHFKPWPEIFHFFRGPSMKKCSASCHLYKYVCGLTASTQRAFRIFSRCFEIPLVHKSRWSAWKGQWRMLWKLTNILDQCLLLQNGPINCLPDQYTSSTFFSQVPVWHTCREGRCQCGIRNLAMPKQNWHSKKSRYVYFTLTSFAAIWLLFFDIGKYKAPFGDSI